MGELLLALNCGFIALPMRTAKDYLQVHTVGPVKQKNVADEVQY